MQRERIHAGERATCGLEHQAIEQRAERAIPDVGHEPAWRDRAQLGVQHAGERLERDDLTGRDRDDGLVGHVDAAAGDRATDELAVGGLGRPVRVLRGDRDPLAGTLRAVHGGVRRRDQARRRVALAGTCDSDRCRDRRHAVAQRQRR